MKTPTWGLFQTVEEPSILWFRASRTRSLVHFWGLTMPKEFTNTRIRRLVVTPNRGNIVNWIKLSKQPRCSMARILTHWWRARGPAVDSQWRLTRKALVRWASRPPSGACPARPPNQGVLAKVEKRSLRALATEDNSGSGSTKTIIKVQSHRNQALWPTVLIRDTITSRVQILRWSSFSRRLSTGVLLVEATIRIIQMPNICAIFGMLNTLRTTSSKSRKSNK